MENRPMHTIKEEARKIIDNLPDQATWDDLMYEFYVKKKIEASMVAAADGRVVSHEEAKRRLLSK